MYVGQEECHPSIRPELHANTAASSTNPEHILAFYDQILDVSGPKTTTQASLAAELLEKEKRIESNLSEFLKHHVNKNVRIALVTSGSTAVPLEKNTVRFIDNFSVGRRGALSVEYLLEQGYAVIFLYRKNTLQPYWQHISMLKDPSNLTSLFERSNGGMKISEPYCDKILAAHASLTRAEIENRLMKFYFFTLYEYLVYLRKACQLLAKFNRRVMIYSAAAVSDFYLQYKDIYAHKIQSRGGGIHLYLCPVPKVLYMVKHTWCPSSFLVTFKLETDPELLETKSIAHLGELYRAQAVVANLLEERAHKVFLFSNTINEDGQSRIAKRIFQVPPESLSEQNLEMELIAHLSECHNKFISDT